jgi:hypothetical protein
MLLVVSPACMWEGLSSADRPYDRCHCAGDHHAWVGGDRHAGPHACGWGGGYCHADPLASVWGGGDRHAGPHVCVWVGGDHHAGPHACV